MSTSPTSEYSSALDSTSTILLPDVLARDIGEIKALLLYWDKLYCLSFSDQVDVTSGELGELRDAGLLEAINVHRAIPIAEIKARGLSHEYFANSIDMVVELGAEQINDILTVLYGYPLGGFFGDYLDMMMALYHIGDLPPVFPQPIIDQFNDRPSIRQELFFIASYSLIIGEIVDRTSLAPTMLHEELSFLGIPHVKFSGKYRLLSAESKYQPLLLDIGFPRAEAMKDVDIPRFLRFRDNTRHDRASFRQYIHSMTKQMACIASDTELAEFVRSRSEELSWAVKEYRAALRQFYVGRVHSILQVNVPSMISSAAANVITQDPFVVSLALSIGITVSSFKWWSDSKAKYAELVRNHPVQYAMKQP